ncbi:MAG: FAD binding domain-containing protein [Planctomycetota bacterium]
MKQFGYAIAADFAAAAEALSKAKNSVAKAGGTDLLDLLKERIYEPDEMIHLGKAKNEVPAGELNALATLADVAGDARIRRDFPALAEAAEVAATPQVRNWATVGGNLCQHTRCWYFRNKDFTCFKRGDDDCSALKDGALNKYNAVFPTKECGCAHPSNLSPALAALDARLRCVHPDGDRELELLALYDIPKKGVTCNIHLRKGELIRSVVLNPTPLTRNSTYIEFRERESFDFAVASVAAALEMDGDTVRDIRLVLGAVSAGPLRAVEAEKIVRGKRLDIDAVAKAALKGATPLSQNAYKLHVTEALVRRALTELHGRAGR